MSGPPGAYARARKLAALIELQLDAPAASSDARQALTGNLNALSSETSSLERAVESLPSGAEAGALWRKRLLQLQQDTQQLRRAVEQHLRRTYDRSRAEFDRAELLGEVGGNCVCVCVCRQR